MILEDLNALGREEAERILLTCCGSRRWASAMADGRPFRELEAIEREADRIWLSLEPADWLEAFAAHPRIGESSSREQAGMDAATDAVRQRLAAANREYEARFGFIYIVCATGKTAQEMLDIAAARLTNAREAELLVAAEEQRKITRLRLEKLFAPR